MKYAFTHTAIDDALVTLDSTSSERNDTYAPGDDSKGFLGELSDFTEASMKRFGFWFDETNVYYDTRGRAGLDALFTLIFEHYDSMAEHGDSAQLSLWAPLPFSGDDDVDYQYSYPTIALEAIDKLIADGAKPIE